MRAPRRIVEARQRPPAGGACGLRKYVVRFAFVAGDPSGALQCAEQTPARRTSRSRVEHPLAFRVARVAPLRPSLRVGDDLARFTKFFQSAAHDFLPEWRYF